MPFLLTHLIMFVGRFRFLFAFHGFRFLFLPPNMYVYAMHNTYTFNSIPGVCVFHRIEIKVNKQTVLHYVNSYIKIYVGVCVLWTGDGKNVRKLSTVENNLSIW